MLKRLNYLIIICTIVISTSCKFRSGESVRGNGNRITEKRTVENATKIAVLGSIDVVLQEGPTSIEVEADENLIPYILTALEDGWVKIKFRDNVNINTSQPVTVFITTPKFSALKATGSGDISTQNKFNNFDGISISITGSGNINTSVNAPEVGVNITGSGSLDINGETKNVDVNITGSGSFNGADLKAENAEVTIAGSGNALVFADDKLKARIMGSGDLQYRGNADIDKKIMGSGSIMRIN